MEKFCRNENIKDRNLLVDNWIIASSLQLLETLADLEIKYIFFFSLLYRLAISIT